MASGRKRYRGNMQKHRVRRPAVCDNSEKDPEALRNRKQERNDYFTYEMLNRNFIVRPGIRGVPSNPPENVKDSMAWYARKEKAWISKHPEIKLSKDDIEKLTSRFKKEGEVSL